HRPLHSTSLLLPIRLRMQRSLELKDLKTQGRNTQRDYGVQLNKAKKPIKASAKPLLHPKNGCSFQLTPPLNWQMKQENDASVRPLLVSQMYNQELVQAYLPQGLVQCSPFHNVLLAADSEFC